MNLYQYVGNDPVNYVDRTGLDADNPVTACHVNRHRDRKENAICASIVVGGAMVCAAATSEAIIVGATKIVEDAAQYGPAIVKATNEIIDYLTPGPSKLGAVEEFSNWYRKQVKEMWKY